MLVLLSSLSQEETSANPEGFTGLKFVPPPPQSKFSLKQKLLRSLYWTSPDPCRVGEDKAAATGSPTPLWLQSSQGRALFHYRAPQLPGVQGSSDSRRALRWQWTPANPLQLSPPHPSLRNPDAQLQQPIKASPSPT